MPFFSEHTLILIKNTFYVQYCIPYFFYYPFYLYNVYTLSLITKSPYTPPNMEDHRLINRPEIRRSIAYTLDLRATGLPSTERWRLGNVVYGGLYRKKYDADLEKAVQYYSSCAKKRRF
ncbi:uncharacterized protein CELE_T23E7.2 [Caenorhabditis elegans]|uniref:Uncharacterized protein n=1 Tax=Caenorhabditis elegans TaxID=6239 RepID=H2KZS5_CAEEL|nr:Uncharacterized protein CELE_T23E7.2 [Caenorhabditis elegans]CCD83564.1 Uncharacterized protein CELE_T23E7.2 [Caenorhabditis elegans]|eukprot:NP_510855.1 Uncharacterized protein CELE_T23E7.2 [Caenorhabditis elegans]